MGSSQRKEYRRSVLAKVVAAASLIAVAILAYILFNGIADALAVASAAASLLIFRITRPRSPVVEAFGRGAVFLTCGFLTFRLIYAFFGPLGFGYAILAFSGSALASAASLLSLLQRQSRPLLSLVGKVFSDYRAPLLVGVGWFLALGYASSYRSLLISSFSGKVFLIEWLAVCLAVAATFRSSVDFLRSKCQVQAFGDWHALMPKNEVNKGKLEEPAEAIRGFVESGNSGQLIPLLTDVLKENRISERDAKRVLSRIYNFRNLSSGMGEGDDRRKRLKILRETLGEMGALLNAGLEAPPAEDKQAPLKLLGVDKSGDERHGS